MKTNQILNLISTLIIMILVAAMFLIAADTPLSWKLFPGDTALLLPILLLLPIIFSIISLRYKKGFYAKFILIISIIFFIPTALLTVYTYALGSSWEN